MSRDATGIYSAWAVEAIACPVCKVPKGERCVVITEAQIVGAFREKSDPIPELPPVEHETHFARTEEAAPLYGDAQRARTATEARVRNHAQERFANDELEIDDDASVSLNDEGGAWVQAYVYVRLADLPDNNEDKVDEDEDELTDPEEDRRSSEG